MPTTPDPSTESGGEFVDFKDEENEFGGGFGYDPDEFSGFPGLPGAPGTSEPVEVETPLSEGLLSLTWVDPTYAKVLWDHDVRFQARTTPDPELAVQHILGVPVGEAVPEKVTAYGETLNHTDLLREMVEFRVDPALMAGAQRNPLADEATLRHIAAHDLPDEDDVRADALSAFETAREVLSGTTSVTEVAQTLVSGGNAVALQMVEGAPDFDSVLTLLAKKEHSSLRKAFLSLAKDATSLRERFLLDFDLNAEDVDLDTLWGLSEEDDLSLAKAMVFAEEPSDLTRSVAERMDEESAWWCAMHQDANVRSLADLSPLLRSHARWVNPPEPEKFPRTKPKPTKPFNPTEFRIQIESMLLAGSTPEAISNMVSWGMENLPEEEAVDLLALGHAWGIVQWLMGSRKPRPRPGFVRRMMEGLPSDKRAEVVGIITGMHPQVLSDLPWSMELFLVMPGMCGKVTHQQAIWARAYIENALRTHPERESALKRVLDDADTWSGSIVELVESIHPAAPGIPTAAPVVESLYY